MAEVLRNSDVVAIWDLHWEYIALKWNMEYAWLAREVNWHLEWTGWNKKVVFQGDILGDRWTDWLKIIEEIHQLREQARKQGWDIDIIAWNHDDFLITYLLWWKVSRFADQSALSVAMINWQWMWLTELLDFIWVERTWEYDDLFSLSWKNKQILNAMRNSPEWRLILEEICSMKLVSQVDDVLYCHTNPTKRMLQYLTNWNVQTNINLLNQKYQWYLRNNLLWEQSASISTEEFNNISDIFLNTWNRNINWIENYVEQLRDYGINVISHGHNWWRGYRTKEINWIKIIDTDFLYWSHWDIKSSHSVSIVKKSKWSIELWDYGKYVWSNIDFYLGDYKKYSWTIQKAEGKNLTIKYFDPRYWRQTHPFSIDFFNDYWWFEIKDNG